MIFRAVETKHYENGSLEDCKILIFKSNILNLIEYIIILEKKNLKAGHTPT